jgi:hypothetical protein
MAEADPHAPVVDPACAFCRIVAGELPASVGG